MVFVPKSNHTLSTAFSRHKVEMWRNVIFQHVCGLYHANIYSEDCMKSCSSHSLISHKICTIHLFCQVQWQTGGNTTAAMGFPSLGTISLFSIGSVISTLYRREITLETSVPHVMKVRLRKQLWISSGNSPGLG